MLVADADNRLEYGGLYLVEFRLERRRAGENGSSLPTARLPAGNGACFRRRRAIVLSDRIAGLQLRYFGSDAPEGEASWHENWPASSSLLPRAVEVTLTFAADDPRIWPPLVVSIPAAR